MVTFNAGLAHGAIAFAKQRRQHLADDLNALAVDVVCMQEVWTDKDADSIVSAVKPVYPFSYRIKTTGDSPRSAKCGLFKALALDSCVRSRCTSEGISVLECVSKTCREPYEALGGKCQRCLAANPTQSWRCASDLFRAQDYVYKGRNGLLLLSRYPIERPKYTAFDTVMVKRGVISATVAGRSVFCTHLTADLDAVPYPEGRTYASFKEEQADQVAWIVSSAPADECVIVLGDLNISPASETLADELSEHFASILGEGFVEPWATRRCTFCRDNPLAGPQSDFQLDHILLRNCAGTESVRYSRVLDRGLELAVGGRLHETRLSDHYGLRLDWEVDPDGDQPN